MKTIALVCRLIAASTGIMLLASCGSTVGNFQPVTPPPGKGVVYVYRQPDFGGAAVYGTVKANENPVTKIKNGGYFPYVGPQGDTVFSVATEARDEATVTVDAKKPKYLKTAIGMGLFVGRLKFSEVSPAIGSSEIVKCKLLDPIQ